MADTEYMKSLLFSFNIILLVFFVIDISFVYCKSQYFNIGKNGIIIILLLIIITIICYSRN